MSIIRIVDISNCQLHRIVGIYNFNCRYFKLLMSTIPVAGINKLNCWYWQLQISTTGTVDINNLNCRMSISVIVNKCMLMSNGPVNCNQLCVWLMVVHARNKEWFFTWCFHFSNTTTCIVSAIIQTFTVGLKIVSLNKMKIITNHDLNYRTGINNTIHMALAYLGYTEGVHFQKCLNLALKNFTH